MDLQPQKKVFFAVDNSPHFVLRSSGHLPTIGRFPALSHFPSKSPWALWENKRATQLGSSLFFMAEDMGLEELGLLSNH